MAHSEKNVDNREKVASGRTVAINRAWGDESMFITVEGVYENGRIELVDPPRGLGRARVLVTFLPDKTVENVQGQMVHGQFKGDRMSTEEDFKFAEWHGEPDEDDEH